MSLSRSPRMWTLVRALIDLPEDLHRQATAIARDIHRTLSETVSCLVRRGLNQPTGGESVVVSDHVHRELVVFSADSSRALDTLDGRDRPVPHRAGAYRSGS
jgi:hypothetical protein